MSENEQETPAIQPEVPTPDAAPTEQPAEQASTPTESAVSTVSTEKPAATPRPAPRPGPRPSAPKPGAPARPAVQAAPAATGEAPAAPSADGAAEERAAASSGSSETAEAAAEAPVTPPAALDPQAVAKAQEFGRVDEEGNVFVKEISGERRVGQVPGASGAEAMEIYIRRFLDLDAQVSLLETRAATAALKDVDQSLHTLQEVLKEPAAVGDLDSLLRRVEAAAAIIDERKERAAAERAHARAAALAEREKVVEEAEKVAAQDPARTQWKQSGEKLRELLGTWQQMQRTGPRLDRAAEDALWKRFSHARTAFDRHRRQFFSELDAKQSQVKAVKEQLIARAEALSTSTDWGRTSGEYRALMSEWKAAGRASRKEDDALWARFRAAQQVFFDARNETNANLDAEYGENLKVKEAILAEAEKLVPVKNLGQAKNALRDLQDRWEQAGKVPRGDVQRVEGRMRKVEQAIRDAEQAEWQRSNPETQARADGMAAQLEASIRQLEEEIIAAREKGDEKAATKAEEALGARRAWLEQVRAAQY